MVGQAKLKKMTHRLMLETEECCIYCAAHPDTVEHMPPLVLFLNRQRPKGLEFAACRECNNGTKGADAVAALFSRISHTDRDPYWENGDGVTLRHTVDRDAPGVRDEVFDERKATTRWMKGVAGVLTPKTIIHADGPLVKAYLDVFAAKLGMALYREHTGRPLALDGGVQTIWYMNGGLSDKTALAHLSILPIDGSLKQGSLTARDQFAYRYNCDEKSIFAALIGLNSNFHIFLIASSTPEKFALPLNMPKIASTTNFLRPGQLVNHLIKHA